MKEPADMVKYRKNAEKSKRRVMKSNCKNCGKSMEDGGFSGTHGLCAKCLGVME